MSKIHHGPSGKENEQASPSHENGADGELQHQVKRELEKMKKAPRKKGTPLTVGGGGGGVFVGSNTPGKRGYWVLIRKSCRNEDFCFRLI